MEIISQDHERVTLAPGIYIISDPCYQVPQDKWGELLNSCDYFENAIVGHYERSKSKTVQVVSFGTAYGDGTYFDQDRTEYGVDAGMVGIMLVSDIGKKNVDSKLGRIVTFTEPFECYSERGVIHFGYIEIDTDPQGDEEEDSSEEDEEETDDYDEEED